MIVSNLLPSLGCQSSFDISVSSLFSRHETNSSWPVVPESSESIDWPISGTGVILYREAVILWFEFSVNISLEAYNTIYNSKTVL